MGMKYIKSNIRRKNKTFMERNVTTQNNSNSNKYPWLKYRDNYEAGIIGLHQEIVDFFTYMRPTNTEYTIRNDVVERVKKLITNKWPYAIVEVFGSYRTGLYLPTSDIDFVAIGKWAKLPLQTLKDELLKYKMADVDTIQIIDKSVVPIIKFTDSRTQIKVDISFNIVNGIKSAELIREYMRRYPVLPPLIMVIKQFLNQRELNEVFTGGLSSYSIILMAVSFIQMHSRRHALTAPETFPDCNLGVLLIEFFELYGRHFNYNTTGIRVDLVNSNGSYFAKRTFAHEESWSGTTSMLCVEDPLLKGNDIAKSSYAFYRVRQAFEYAYVVLSRAVLPAFNDSEYQSEQDLYTLLGQVIYVPAKVRNYRKWIRTTFGTINSNGTNQRALSSPTSTISSTLLPITVTTTKMAASMADRRALV